MTEQAYDVFLSVTVTAQDEVGPLLAGLEARGFHVFYAPRDLESSPNWQEATRDALRRSRALVGFVSEDYHDPARFTSVELRDSRTLKIPFIAVAFRATLDSRVVGPADAVVEWSPAAPEAGVDAVATALTELGVVPNAARAAVAALTVDVRGMADQPAERDLLNFEPLVLGLATLLNDPHTALPLSIGVTAPWGGGKSSVMLQLRRRLDPKFDAGKEGRLTEPPDPDVSRAGSWVTVEFPAWLHAGRERLWAAVAQAVYEQPQRRMSWLDKLRFRTRLELERHGGRVSLAVLAIGALTTIAVVVAWVLLDLGGVLAGVIGVLTAVAAGLGQVWRAFRGALRRHARMPDYRMRLGQTDEARRDIEALMSVLTRDGRSVAVFVDDLDRLGSAEVVEVVETVNQMFHATRSRCAFVLGFDPAIVSASLAAAYGETIENLPEGELRDDFGDEFLSKIVQLTVAVPQPRRDALAALLEESGQRDAGGTEGTDGGSSPDDGDDQPADAPPQAGPTDRAERTVAAIGRSQEVIEAEAAILGHVPPNPRQVKRIVNAFRLQVYAAAHDRRNRREVTPDLLAALGRWVVLRIEWPEVARRADARLDELRFIEAVAAEEDPKHDGIPAATIEYSEDEALLALLKDANPERRASALDPQDYVRIA